jgi:hypothetical protein
MPGDVKCHLSGFVYSSSADPSGAIAPPCPVGSAYHRLFWQCAAVRAPTSVAVNCLIDRCGVPKLVVSSGKPSKLSADTSVVTGTVSEKRLEAWTQELREVFSKLVNKKALKLSLVDYDSFCEYYVANIRGNSTEAKKIADARGGRK